MNNISINKPECQLRTPHKMLAGILSLIFGIAFAFVFMEERQRGIAFIVAIPFAISILWFTWLSLQDNECLNRYKKYKHEIAKLKQQKDIPYEYASTKTFVNIIGLFLIILTFIAYSQRLRSAYGIFLLALFMLIIYGILDYLERDYIEESINKIESTN